MPKMKVTPEGKDLLPYYGTVRDTIKGLDTLITDILTKGATATVAILVGPLAIFKTNNEIQWKIVFFTSIFALLAAVYVLIAVALYSDLLRKAVVVSEKLEKGIFEGADRTLLTTALDQNPLAGGKAGTVLYLGLVVCLYFASDLFSTWYFSQWNSHDSILVWYFAGLLILLVILIFWLRSWGVLIAKHGRFLSYLVLFFALATFVWIQLV
jgi:hypothetical protein